MTGKGLTLFYHLAHDSPKQEGLHMLPKLLQPCVCVFSLIYYNSFDHTVEAFLNK